MYAYVHLRKVGATFPYFLFSKIHVLFSYFTRKCVVVLYSSSFYSLGMITTKFFTTRETAELLRTTPRGVDNLVYRGMISYVKRGGKRLFRESDIADYLSQDVEIPAFGRREDD